MKVLIGTKNPGKIEGARQALACYFEDVEIEGVAVSSEVGEEPLNEQIYIGARNRVDNLMRHASKNKIEADYFLGIESGLTNLLGKWMIVSIAVIKDKDGYESFGTSSAFPVPEKYVEEIISTDLGEVMDKIFEEKDLRSGKEGIGLLTKDVISRIDQGKEAFVMALTQFLNENWTDKFIFEVE